MTLVRFSLFGGGGGKNDNELGTWLSRLFHVLPFSCSDLCSSTSFSVVKETKRRFSSFLLPFGQFRTHTHTPRLRKRRRREWSLGAFLSSFSVGFCCCRKRKEHRERERWISRRRLSVCYIEKEEVEKSSRHNRLRVRIVEKKEERKMLAVYKRERDLWHYYSFFFFLGFLFYVPFSFHNSLSSQTHTQSPPHPEAVWLSL